MILLLPGPLPRSSRALPFHIPLLRKRRGVNATAAPVYSLLMPDAAFIECSRCRQPLLLAHIPARCPGCGAEFHELSADGREASLPKRTPVGGIITPQ